VICFKWLQARGGVKNPKGFGFYLSVNWWLRNGRMDMYRQMTQRRPPDSSTSSSRRALSRGLGYDYSNSLGSNKIQEQLRTPSTSKMTLQFERKYSTQGSGAPCHMSFGFFSRFYGIILPELQIDPQPESTTQSKARGLLHMECDFAIAFPYKSRLQDNASIIEDLRE
jgi:hypothetical protein